MAKQLTPEILGRIAKQIAEDEEALYKDLPDAFLVSLGPKLVLTDKPTFKEFMRLMARIPTVAEVTREFESWGRDAIRFDTNRLDTLMEKRLGTGTSGGERGGA